MNIQTTCSWIYKRTSPAFEAFGNTHCHGKGKSYMKTTDWEHNAEKQNKLNLDSTHPRTANKYCQC